MKEKYHDRQQGLSPETSAVLLPYTNGGGGGGGGRGHSPEGRIRPTAADYKSPAGMGPPSAGSTDFFRPSNDRSSGYPP